MPSALAANSDVALPLHFSAGEPNGQMRTSFEKVNGSIKSSSRSPVKRSLENGSEDLYDGQYSMKSRQSGDGQKEAGLSSLPNGRTSGGSFDRKSTRNDSSMSSNGGLNGSTAESGRYSPMLNGLPKSSQMDRNHDSSTNGYASQPPTSKLATISTFSEEIKPVRGITVPPEISTNPQSTGPLTYAPSLTPTATGPDTPLRANNASQHRFSSPPAYSQPTTSTAAHNGLAPNSVPHSGSAQLKHRHTLQVPKIGTGRNSRDGADDVVSATGRFSPTALTNGVRRGSLTLNRRNTRSVHSEIPHEEVPQDEDALRWAEAIRQKRAGKRKRKDEEDDDRVVVGTKVDQNHVNWVTAYNMLTGIRFTVSRTNAKLDRPLTDADFEARHKFSFDITGNELTPSAKYDFKFKDYAPWVFRHLRAKFKLDPADYLMSLTSKYILSELGSPGKSGSFFYFSRDYKYIIKTIHHAEHKFLRKILKEYYDHVMDNPNTLLSQFYGLHRVKIPYGRKIHFVVMNNLFPPHRDIHQTFDLKGSTIGRDFKEEDLEHNPRATLKDLNWLRRHLHLEFGPEKKDQFIEQMQQDVRLLQKLKIMDYSLLVGIHDLRKGNIDNLRDKTLKVFQPGGDSPIDEQDIRGLSQSIARTPSKLENARNARELRQIIKQEKPIPMGQSSSRMPDYMEENTLKKGSLFYNDDGGFQATHDDNRAGEEVYYLGIIDCLTRYGTVKKLEHFWKGMSNDKSQISPVPADPYGNRFIKFITGITKTAEEAERTEVPIPEAETGLDGSATTSRQRSGSQHLQRTITSNTVIQKAETQMVKAERKGAGEGDKNVERVLTSTNSPSGANDRNEQGGSMVLPVVEEQREGSTSGISSKSRDESEKDSKFRPPTPPKDNNLAVPRQNNGNEKTVKRMNSLKELPPIPSVSSPIIEGDHAFPAL